MRFLTRLLCSILLACLCARAQAQTAPAFNSIHFTQLGVAQGLPSHSVTALVQDRQGFMWIGGRGGLCRYDGYRFTVFRHDALDPASLDSDLVQVLHVDPQGRLWVGTWSGLNLYDPRSERFVRIPGVVGNTLDAGVTAIADAGQGRLWLGTRVGLQLFDPESNRFRFWRHDSGDPLSLANDEVHALAVDNAGTLWVGTASGVDRLNGAKSGFDHLALATPPVAGPDANGVNVLRFDGLHRLWIGSKVGLEVWEVNGAAVNKRHFGAADGVEPAEVADLLEDLDGRQWVALHGKGLLRWDRQRLRFDTIRHQPTESDSLVDDQSEVLYQDRGAILWVGTYLNGISRVDLASGGFSHWVEDRTLLRELGNRRIGAIAAAGDGRLWLSTDGGGLRRLDPRSGKVDTYRHGAGERDARAGDIVMGIAGRADGQLWLATGRGLERFDPVRRLFTLVLANLEIHDILLAADGSVWLACADGLRQLDRQGKPMAHYRHQQDRRDSLAHDFVTKVLQDRTGAFWIGTANGLDRLDPHGASLTHVRHDNKDRGSLGGNAISALFLDAHGALWVASDAGLARLLDGSASRPVFRRYPGTPDVAAIVEQADGKLWLAHDTGISELDPASGRLTAYNERHGAGAGPYYNGSAWRDVQGVMYFGGLNGLTAFRPDAVRTNGFAPPVVFTDFQIFNKSIRAGKIPADVLVDDAITRARAITLSYRHTVFSIEFAALHYGDSQHNHYAYQLQGEGGDAAWIEADAGQRFVTYNRLDPGHYVFKVKAANQDGVWSGESASLAIDITPPLWQRWWFRTGMVALAALALWALYRLRLRVLLRQRRQLAREVARRTEQVRRQSALIEGQKLLVEQNKSELEIANRALTQANQAQRQHSNELTRFLAVASHDLRQPMHALTLYLGALDGIALPREAHPILRNARQCADTMDEMFLALLDLSRLDAQVVRPELCAFPLSRVLNRIDIEFAPQAKAKGLAFQVDACSAWVNSDASLVEQILRNLTANAVKYTQAGQVVITCSEQGDMLKVAVNDTGIGISAQQQETVFDEFTQLGVGGRDRAAGLGLGLSIVRRLARLLGTRVSLVSAPGQGSSFAIALALAATPAQAPEADIGVDEVDILPGKLVVVIEDEASIRDAMRQLLEQWGCTVVAGADASAVLANLMHLQRRPDVLLCDFQLGDQQSGLDVIAWLCEEFNHELPALLITGNTSASCIARIAASGLPVLHKPVHADALRQALRQLGRGRRL